MNANYITNRLGGLFSSSSLILESEGDFIMNNLYNNNLESEGDFIMKDLILTLIEVNGDNIREKGFVKVNIDTLSDSELNMLVNVFGKDITIDNDVYNVYRDFNDFNYIIIELVKEGAL